MQVPSSWLRRKQDVRICSDFRELNKKTIRDHYPLPIVEDQLNKQKPKYLPHLTLKMDSSMPVEEESRKYTFIIIPNG